MNSLLQLLLARQWEIFTLTEVYMDNLIGVAWAVNIETLWHASRVLLHAIHAIFPPQSITKHQGGNPISLKKLLAGDKVWAIRKEILR